MNKDKLIEALKWAERNVDAFDLQQYASDDPEYVVGKSYFEGQVDILKQILSWNEELALESWENRIDTDE